MLRIFWGVVVGRVGGGLPLECLVFVVGGFGGEIWVFDFFLLFWIFSIF